MGHAYILLALAVLTWAIGLIIGRAVYEEIPPVGLSFWRWQIAALILLPFCWQAVWRNIHVVRENLMYFFWQGVCFYTFEPSPIQLTGMCTQTYIHMIVHVSQALPKHILTHI